MTTRIEIPPAGTRGVQLRGMRLFHKLTFVQTGMYRLLGGRFMGQSVLVSTVGSRTSKSRTVLVYSFPEGNGRWLVVASNAGAAQHPAWFVNLARNADQVWLEVGRDRFKVTPELLRGEDRAAAWARVVSEVKGYGKYEQQTDREIPVVRLTRES